MSVITNYSKKFGLLVMLILPLFVIVFLLIGVFTTDISADESITNVFTVTAAILWVILFLNSTTLSLSGLSLAKDFNKEVKRLHNSGFPIKSVEGFGPMEGKIKTVFSSSIFISIIVFLSLVTFLAILIVGQFAEFLVPADSTNKIADRQAIQGNLRLMVILISVSLILIAIGISLLLSLPDQPALEPGALMKYFSPNTIPSQIDNFLSDTLFPFLDPITRTRWDEWTNQIADNLHSDFLSHEDDANRLEVAREKILLFSFLSKSMSIITDDVVKSELSEVLANDQAIQDMFDGKGSGVTWKILSDIMDKVEKEAPEIFDVLNRIIVQLKDNLENFKDQDLYITVAAPPKVGGNTKPFRLLIFMLNKDEKNWSQNKRPVTVHMNNDDMRTSEKYELHLDEAEDMVIDADELPFTADEGPDLVGVLSRILQVGDAVWFQVYRRTFTNHIFNVRVDEEGRGAIFGRSINIRLVRDMKFYAQQYGGKLSAVVGAIVPLVGSIVLFGF